MIAYNLNSIRAPLTGIGRYASELIAGGLKLRNDICLGLNQKIYTGSEIAPVLANLNTQTYQSLGRQQTNRNIRNAIASIPLSRDIRRELNNFWFQHKIDGLNVGAKIIHDLNYAHSWTRKKTDNRLVTTVYDLSHIVVSTTHPKHRVKYMEKYFDGLSCAEYPIITISEAIKKGLTDRFPIDSKRVHVTHLAADVAFKPMDTERILTKLSPYSLQAKKYILSVGTVEPRKNLLSLLNAYASLDPTIKNEYPLVVLGAYGWQSAELEKKINELQSSGELLRLGFVPQRDLPFLYAGAAAFVYPSLYEGFGLPLLEAMQSGCPSIISKDPALTEVADGNALQVDALDSDALAESLTRLLSDSELANRYSLAGIERAKDFSWKKTVDETHKIYASL